MLRVVIGTLAVLSCAAAAAVPEKKGVVASSTPEDQTSAGGHHQSEWVPASGHALQASGGAHSYVAGGQAYGRALAAGPSPAYYNPYGYHAVHAAGPALAAHAHAQPIHYAAPAGHVQYAHGHGHGHEHEHGHAEVHAPAVEVAPVLHAGYKAVVHAEPLVQHQQKKIIHQHHEHQKVIHQHHIHQHVVHEHHLHKVHLHDLHLQDHNIHQHHKHIEHIHVPIYHTHKKHALKETEEHQTRHTHGETHEHAPPKIIETKSHAPPVYHAKAAAPLVHAHAHGHAHAHHAAPVYATKAVVHGPVHASPAPLFYKSQQVHNPWG